MAFDYITSGPPKIPAPTTPATAFDKDNNNLYVSSMPSAKQSPAWILVGGDETGNATEIQSVPVSPAGPTNGQALVFNGSEWIPATLAPSGNATSIQSVPVVGTAPTNNQILQYNGVDWTPATVAGISNYQTFYATDFNWSQTQGAGDFPALTAGTPATIILPTAPNGIDTSARAGIPYYIYISGTGTAEAVLVTGGTSAEGVSNGTVTFTPFFNHTTGYTVSSASAGIAEAINHGGGISGTYPNNGYARIVIPPSVNPYHVYGTIAVQQNGMLITGYGAYLACTTRGPVFQIGPIGQASTHAVSNVIEGVSFQSPTDFSGVPEYRGSLITSTSRASSVATINTSAAHGFRVGDPITLLFTDDSSYWGNITSVLSVPTATSFTYSNAAGDAGSQTTPGVVALSYYCVRDNGDGTFWRDISLFEGGNGGAFNGVFDLWDNESCTIDNFNNNGIPLNINVNWTPAFVHSYGANVSQQQAPVISLRNSSITAQVASAVTILNNNGLYIDNTVLQATGPWQINASNIRGNFQGGSIRNLYSESNGTINPVSPVRTPWPGLGIAGFIGGPSTGAASFSVSGNGNLVGPINLLPTIGSSGNFWVYYIVIHDTTTGTSSAPLPVMYTQSTGGSVTVSWPRVANGTDTITYDVLRLYLGANTSIDNVFSVGPYSGGCPGGSPTAAGSVVTGQAQQSGFVQTFTDNTTNNTTSYASVPTGNYTGNIVFWPGQCTVVNIPFVSESPIAVSSTGMAGAPSAIVHNAMNGSIGTPVSTTTVSTRWTLNNSITAHQALLLNDGPTTGANSSSLKGRLNFSTSGLSNLAANPHIITLVDSNPLKTRAYNLNRPPVDANDTFIGLDSSSGNVSAAQLAFGSPVSISNYIGNVGDGTSFKERLTSTLKTFTVPTVTPTHTPSSSSDTGTAGQFAWDTNFIYICTATNTWKRVAIATW